MNGELFDSQLDGIRGAWSQHALEKLRNRMRGHRETGLLARASCGTITVRRSDVPPDFNRHSGAVLIDKRIYGDLVGDCPRVFRVPPGRHRVVVCSYFSSDSPVPSKRFHFGAGSILTINVEEGEQIDLFCGVHPESILELKSRSRETIRRILRRILIATVLLCGFASWVNLAAKFGLLREIAAWIVLHGNLRAPFAGLLYSLVSPAFITCVGMFIWCFAIVIGYQDQEAPIGELSYLAPNTTDGMPQLLLRPNNQPSR
jgi:hypothetical protein